MDYELGKWLERIEAKLDFLIEDKLKEQPQETKDDTKVLGRVR